MSACAKSERHVAGDDTVMVIVAETSTGAEIAAELQELAGV